MMSGFESRFSYPLLEIKMKIQEIMKELTIRAIDASMHYDKEREKFFIDLNTMTKSSLCLYECGRMLGRYQYQKEINLEQDIEMLIDDLCVQFTRAMHGKDYGNEVWINLSENRWHAG